MNEILEKFKSLDPKIILILVGCIAAFAGIENNLNAEMWAESGWGEECKTDDAVDCISSESMNIAETYEKIWGLFIVPIGLLCITAALVLDDKNRAVMAFYSGSLMLVFFIVFFIFLNSTDYSSPTAEFIVPPFILLGIVIYSGYKHMQE
ncbi:hypothetical protein OAK07_01935 [Marine Group III euryarchaeote]|nr:hypothetical protein [Marine Group III euryarchaeote]